MNCMTGAFVSMFVAALFPAGRILLFGGALIVAVLAMGVVILWARRRYRSADSDGDEQAGFSIEQLEALRKSRQISPAEFARLRRSALGLDVRDDKRENSTSSPPAEGDDGEGDEGDD